MTKTRRYDTFDMRKIAKIPQEWGFDQLLAYWRHENIAAFNDSAPFTCLKDKLCTENGRRY